MKFKIASEKQQGEDYPELPLPGKRIHSAEVWEEWVEELAAKKKSST